MGELTSTSHKSNLAGERSRRQAKRAGDGTVLLLLRRYRRGLGSRVGEGALPVLFASGGRGVGKVEGLVCPCWCHFEIVL